ncbi:phosphoadenylyl-sulfate reductase [Thalassotalea euphylliae]|uniref:Phosphoadenosine 5'-phosphosulfate reductase n=1 Tax=Thalassotalea euphylliae TaxID=1655234 RepID=A0A3E0U1V3_9GAMM|nr:phosphoadenylyl-sulfate reductase [Thalassotalea euphylliae]REL25436.1 phosphoadenylyl-sulfate reductase [Thalassotalea euphylliae]REL30908.1 phosphoadenylyl-sulfate reductase [Thalassotalea euphylliae]
MPSIQSEAAASVAELPVAGAPSSELSPATVPAAWLSQWNEQLEKQTPQERVAWAMENLPGNFVLSSSFGIQSAVMLHLLTQVDPNIPVLVTDTGHLFPETYRFIDELTTKLNLNLQVYSAKESAAWQLAKYGEQWAQGADELKRYNQMNKVEPLERGLTDLGAGAWFSGVRRQQSDHRASLSVVSTLRGRFKVHPIIDWSNRDVHQYLTKHGLPYHPLWDQGYVSVGDTHSTRPLTADMDESDTRFNGMQRECGLHTDGDGI